MRPLNEFADGQGSCNQLSYYEVWLRFKVFALQVTPSSKVVGDLAQFMVQNDLDEHSVVERAGNLNFPQR